jgi:DNA/RNA endonuclease YhcR with UshA esterase domain
MRKLVLAIAGVLCAAVPLPAHHSVAGEYDVNKPVTIKGTVSKLEWTNPHSRIYVDVKDAGGKVTTWNIELAARTALTRQGRTGRSVTIGANVTGEGDLARSGVAGGHARTVVLADGTKVFSGANDNN